MEFRVGVVRQESGVSTQESGVRGQDFELEFRVGEWWGVFSHKEQEKQEVSGVGVQSWSWRAVVEIFYEFFLTQRRVTAA